jgi:hypothetical protein
MEGDSIPAVSGLLSVYLKSDSILKNFELDFSLLTSGRPIFGNFRCEYSVCHKVASDPIWGELYLIRSSPRSNETSKFKSFPANVRTLEHFSKEFTWGFGIAYRVSDGPAVEQCGTEH